MVMLIIGLLEVLLVATAVEVCFETPLGLVKVEPLFWLLRLAAETAAADGEGDFKMAAFSFAAEASCC